MPTVTVLPMAHPFAEPTDGGRRCAACGKRRRFGIHADSPRRIAAGARRTRRVAYRTSGTPRLARPGVWTALPATTSTTGARA